MDKKSIEIENEKILASHKPNNYLPFAIICTIVCFAPMGVFALFYSLRVNQAWEEDNHSKARRYSHISRTFCLLTIALGIIFWLGIILGAFYNTIGNKIKIY